MMRGGTSRPLSRWAGSTLASGTLPSSSTSASRTTSSGLVWSTHGTSSTANSTPASSRCHRRSMSSTASSTRSSNCSARVRASGTSAGTRRPRTPRPCRSRRGGRGAGEGGRTGDSSRAEPTTRDAGRDGALRCRCPRGHRAGWGGPAGFPVRLMPTTPVRDYCPQREEPVVRQSRRCSRSGCAQPAAATLTYVYAESTAVVGPLATFSEPHSYDLCEFHAERLTVPRGWEVVRHEIDLDDAGPTGDDLLALADAVREAARPEPPRNPADDGSGTRRGHLRVLPDLT